MHCVDIALDGIGPRPFNAAPSRVPAWPTGLKMTVHDGARNIPKNKIYHTFVHISHAKR